MLPTLTHLHSCVVFYMKTLDEEKFPLNYMEIFQKVFDMRFLKLRLSIKPQKTRISQISESRVCVPVSASWGGHSKSPHTGACDTLTRPATIWGPEGKDPRCHGVGSLLRGRSFVPLPAPGAQASLAWAMSPSVLAVPAPQTSLLEGCLSLELSHPSPGCLLWRAHLQRPNCIQFTFTG